ncbi:MAG: hypothetical protein LBO67_10055 [Spirochaetaceae bacterium]|jgi:hypothetical protein|nr:hypothetical protein [Spirochaetaceae bacterium]
MKDMLIKNKPRASKRSDWVLNTSGSGMVALSLMVVLALRISRGGTPTLGERGVKRAKVFEPLHDYPLQ